jgi:hypothetical protein
MMKKLLLSTVVALLSVGAAHAYQTELSGGVNYGQVNDRTSSSAGLTGSGTYFFNNVTNNAGPLAEDAFVERASSVSANYGYSYDQDHASQHNVNAFALGAEVYVPNTNYYATANVSHVNGQGNGSNGGEYNVAVGILPINNLLITAGIYGTYNLADNQTDATIHAKYLTKIGNHDVNLESGVRFGSGDSAYNFKGDYFIDRTLSVGATYDLETTNHTSSIFGVNARKFLAENISVQGGVFLGNDVNSDTDFGLNVGGTYRF